MRRTSRFHPHPTSTDPPATTGPAHRRGFPHSRRESHVLHARIQAHPKPLTTAAYGYSCTPKAITIHWWGGKGQKHRNVVDWLRGITGNRGCIRPLRRLRRTSSLSSQTTREPRGTAATTAPTANTIGIEMRPEMTGRDWRTLVELCVNLENGTGFAQVLRPQGLEEHRLPRRLLPAASASWWTR